MGKANMLKFYDLTVLLPKCEAPFLQIGVLKSNNLHRTYVTSGLFWVATQRVVLNTYRRSGTTYRAKTVPIGCPETSVRNYQYSLRNNTEERRSDLDRGRNLKSRAEQRCFLKAKYFYGGTRYKVN
jgi:hypothetical protein